ncbi:MAG: DUF5677 domain-containing protein [Candidatus Wallbacteria bacterium]|nr:DUF5677 domain-containing protein [Candidatus Wallbacteria bacterium]
MQNGFSEINSSVLHESDDTIFANLRKFFSDNRNANDLKESMLNYVKSKNDFEGKFISSVLVKMITKDVVAKSVSDEFFTEFTDSLQKNGKEFLKIVKKIWPVEKKRKNDIFSGFLERLNNKWNAPIDLLEMLYSIVFEVGNEISKSELKNTRKNNDFKLAALVKIHVNSCLVYAEIISLLKNGFSDGAMARWRTLHEYAVVSSFLLDQDQETSEKFLLHEFVEIYDQMVSYMEHCNALGYEKITTDEMQKMECLCKNLYEKYGTEFKNDYGWAYPVLKNTTFRSIEKAIELSKWRPFYKLSCWANHCCARGLTYKLGKMDTCSGLGLAGASNYGLADPGQNAGTSLSIVTASLIAHAPSVERLMILQAIQELSPEIGTEFCRVQKEVEEDEMRFNNRMQEV